MIIGVPKEIKDNEYRVSLTPGGTETLVHAGHRVLVEANAGDGSGFADQEYAEAGAEVIGDAASTWNQSDMVMKVKEPLPQEIEFLRASGGSSALSLTGNEFDQFVVGTSGADIINGGLGDDYLIGNAGADIFVFGNDWGTDRITDYEDGIDRIDVQGVAFEDLTIEQSGNSTEISFGDDVIVVFNTTVGDFSGADFI